MSNEGEKELKYARFFNPQGLEKKQHETLEESVEEGMRLGYLIIGGNGLEFIGPGTKKLTACLILDPGKTSRLASQYLEAKLLDQEKSEELWASRCDGRIVPESWKAGYLSERDRLRNVREAFMSGEEISISLWMLQNPGYDHSKDKVLTLKRNETE